MSPARVRSVAVAGLFALAALVLPTSASAARGPQLELITASPTVQLVKYGRSPLYFDLGVFVGSRGGDLRIDVQRPGYLRPIQATEVLPGARVRLPAWTVPSWGGLFEFVHYTITDSRGVVVTKHATSFCPNSYSPQRFDPNGPLNPTFPQGCSFNPFTLGDVWGINRGWATALADNAPVISLPLGTYSVTVSIDPRYATLFHIPAASASTTVSVQVVKPQQCTSCAGRGARANSAPAALPANVPLMLHPTPSVEPDLIPLPSWGISTNHQGTRDFIDFGATVWDAGQAPMDVEGFRVSGTNTMNAFQYFFRNGKVVGRAPAGTMQFDSSPSEQEWHFEQFAAYSLVNKTLTQVVRSRKVGFCLAPTDAIDLMTPGAVLQPYSIGLQGACGYATSLWTRETLPSGWGDTYFQSLPEQSLDITTVPNGIYYIKVQANPLGLIHEVTRRNDVRLREVILGGTPGHRTVTVPAWNGIDPEP